VCVARGGSVAKLETLRQAQRIAFLLAVAKRRRDTFSFYFVLFTFYFVLLPNNNKKEK